ncbi:MAG: DUF2510 domain-containing protein [Acidimicrobiales bacterium]
MSGQIAGPSRFTLELIVGIVALSMVLGAVDIIRQPGWAWKRADENKIAYLVLDLLLPVIGLSLYALKARTKVRRIAADGRAASLPFEQFQEELAQMQRDDHPTGDPSPTPAFGSFGAAATDSDLSELAQGASDSEDAVGGHNRPVEISSTFFSSGATATRSVRPQLGLARGYRPKQRTSLRPNLRTPDNATPTVPAGWKADPTGRHQFRYWDGFHWTENVADAGEQSIDAVSA